MGFCTSCFQVLMVAKEFDLVIVSGQQLTVWAMLSCWSGFYIGSCSMEVLHCYPWVVDVESGLKIEGLP